tara:strand:+ start:17613 stop:18116 length:504 start_codon:yes stop_codon:yes gene_type:complete
VSKKKEQEVRELNIDGLAEEDAKFVSNVTGIGWRKNSHKRWNKVINQIGIVIKDEIHQAKNHTTVTLKAGSEVIVDDIRGRINPQYRVRDANGKIWFVSATNIEFSFNTEIQEENKNNPKVEDTYVYRGGIRVDGTDEVNDVLPKRYEMPATTDEEIKLLKEKKSNG